MRKYDSKNKMNIGIIIGICLIFAIIFSYFLIRIINTSKIKYILESNTILFDSDKTSILLKEDGVIRKKWKNNYYLDYQDNQYAIGSNVIAFNNNEKSLVLYGKFYEINSNSDINITSEETKLNNLGISRFYKITDRKYLVVDSNISTSDNTLNTSNYLIIELDKKGNAILYNNNLNLKTFSETKITTTSYVFDIANELLLYGEKEIDLKKILGTTNEYKKEEDKKNNSNGNTTTNNNVNNNSNNTVVNKSTNKTKENETYVSESEIINETSYTSILRITPSICEINIDYVIYDKANEYLTTFVEIRNNNNKKVVHLSKGATSITLSDLLPDNEYELTFKYTHLDNNEVKEEIIDKHIVKTLVPDISLIATKVTNKEISYKINILSYTITSAKLTIYINNEKSNKELNITSNNMEGKINISSLNIPNNALVELRLTDIYINNNKIEKEINWSYKYKTVNRTIEEE